MAVVQNTYTGNGSTVLYSLSFSYLDQTDVKVSVNGTIVTNYIFATASSIQFLTAPGAGAAIRIYRETDIDQQSATIFPGSAIKAQDLNDNFTQTLYAVQESNFEADSATTTANTALTTANTAISTANAATSTANTALSNSTAAVSTANAASAAASSAVTTANTASSNASAAVTTANAATVTANSAASTAATALSTANTASSNASAAVSTANTASTNASNAVTTANTALSTANTASSNASAAVTTANSAVSTANGAVSTANTALSTANAAISAVASAVIYTPVANLTALAALTPTNGDYFELTDSTGAEGSALITGVTVGLVGAPGLTFRLRYDAPPGIFTFLGYFANDSETRYLKLAGGTLTGQLRGDDSTSASTPGFAFDGDPNTGVGRPGADELALITGGSARLTIDPAGAVAVAGSLSQGGNAVVVTTDSRLSDTRTPTDGTVTNVKVAAAAAIDGTKISPNFGSQNVLTTGTVTGSALIPSSSSVPTNGVYLPAANSVAVATNGTGRLFVDSSGRILTGTSTARSNFFNSTVSALYQVEGSLDTTSRISSQTYGAASAGGPIYIFAKHRSNSIGGNTVVQSGDYLGEISFQGNDGTEFVEAVTIRAEIDGTPGANDMPGRLIFATTADNAAAPTERMRIDSSGRVGIGTTSPGQPLDISATQAVARLTSTTGTNYCYSWFANTAGNAFVGLETSAGGTSGVGTAPYALTIAHQGAYPINFATNNSLRATIDSSGRFLVGTSSWSGGASVTGGVELTSGSYVAGGQVTQRLSSFRSSASDDNGGADVGIDFYRRPRGGGVQSGTEIRFYTGYTYLGGTFQRATLTQDGAMLVPYIYNTTSASAANVIVGSDGNLFRSTSSGKYKTEIEDLQDVYADALLECRPVWYRSTCELDDPSWGYWGFIAEEVAEIDPRLVHWKTQQISYDDKGSVVTTPCEPEPEGVQYDRFVPHLLNLIKRQKEQIEAMEARLSALEAA